MKNSASRQGVVQVIAFSFITKAFADVGLAGEHSAMATIITVEIVCTPPDYVGFAMHPRPGVVERFIACISRNRHLRKDPEAILASAKAFPDAAAVHDPRQARRRRDTTLWTNSRSERPSRSQISRTSLEFGNTVGAPRKLGYLPARARLFACFAGRRRSRYLLLSLLSDLTIEHHYGSFCRMLSYKSLEVEAW